MSDVSSQTHSHGAAARLPSRAMEISAGLTVTRLGNNTGVVKFADKTYAAG